MLAGHRRIQKVINLRAKINAWSNDATKFGQRMLEKMGWSSGKGLGAKENGIVEHVVAKYKNDEKGLGYEDKDDQWTKHEDDFNALLANLSSGGNAEDNKEVTLHSSVSLEEKSKKSRARIHYHKSVRGKDLTRYSNKDLANIFGKKSLDTEEETKKVRKQTPKKVAQTTEQVFTEKGSMEDYFKGKMDAFKSKSHLSCLSNRESLDSRDIEFGFRGFPGPNDTQETGESHVGFGFQSFSCNSDNDNAHKDADSDHKESKDSKKRKRKQKSKTKVETQEPHLRFECQSSPLNSGNDDANLNAESVPKEEETSSKKSNKKKKSKKKVKDSIEDEENPPSVTDIDFNNAVKELEKDLLIKKIKISKKQKSCHEDIPEYESNEVEIEPPTSKKKSKNKRKLPETCVALEVLKMPDVIPTREQDAEADSNITPPKRKKKKNKNEKKIPEYESNEVEIEPPIKMKTNKNKRMLPDPYVALEVLKMPYVIPTREQDAEADSNITPPKKKKKKNKN